MARVTLLPPSVGASFIYNVDLAVGPGSPNKRDDVLLVQYFLKTINDNPNAFNPPLKPVPLSPGETFKVDGLAGPITFRAIKHFQEQERARGKNIATDGRVDKATGRGFGTISNTQLTITFLNFGYRTIRPNDFKNISLAGDCPPDLKGSVSLSD